MDGQHKMQQKIDNVYGWSTQNATENRQCIWMVNISLICHRHSVSFIIISQKKIADLNTAQTNTVFTQSVRALGDGLKQTITGSVDPGEEWRILPGIPSSEDLRISIIMRSP